MKKIYVLLTFFINPLFHDMLESKYWNEGIAVTSEP
jgi:hypothetical protein